MSEEREERVQEEEELKEADSGPGMPVDSADPSTTTMELGSETQVPGAEAEAEQQEEEEESSHLPSATSTLPMEEFAVEPSDEPSAASAPAPMPVLPGRATTCPFLVPFRVEGLLPHGPPLSGHFHTW
jgi:hypothetical protein